MGRPFIVYDDDKDESDGSDSSPSSSSQRNHDPWMQTALESLGDQGFDVSDQDLLTILSFILTKRRLAYIPSCEPVASSRLGLLHSKIGGLPYLMPSESWPSDNGTGLSFLWQQNVCELPADVKVALGYSYGLLQVFVADELDGNDGKWFLVRVLPEEALTARSPSDIVVGPGVAVLPEQRVRGFTSQPDWPHLEDLLAELPQGMSPTLTEDVVAVLQSCGLCETVTGDKLLGWPNWCQGAEWRRTAAGERYLQLVQIEGDIVPFVVGDSGTLLLQRHPADRNLWDASWAWSAAEDRSRP